MHTGPNMFGPASGEGFLRVRGTMPLFYFHIRTPIESIEDPEGLDLPDLEAARREAIDSLRSIISEDVRHGVLGLDEWIDVTNPSETLLLTVRAGDALSIATLDTTKQNAIVSPHLGPRSGGQA